MAADFNPLDLHEFVGKSDMTLGEMITSFRQAKDRRLLSGLRGLLTHRDELAQELAKIDAQLDEMRRLLELKGENDGKNDA